MAPDVAESLELLAARLPLFDIEDVFSFLVSVGEADGPLSQGERRVLGQIADGMGLIFEPVGAPMGGMAIGAAYEVFGLPVGASFEDVKIAYRALLKDYHPDRVATMPVGFRQCASQKTMEIQQANEVIRSQLN